MKPSKTHVSRSRSTIKASLVAGACVATSVTGLVGITGLVGTQVASASPTVTLQFWNAYNLDRQRSEHDGQRSAPTVREREPGDQGRL